MMMDKDFLLRPLGALFFGHPRSFFAGEAHRATSLFPPPQSAFQGMVRSQLLRAANIDFVTEKARIPELVGNPDALPEGWQLQGPFPARVVGQGEKARLQPWLPTPRFLLRNRDGGRSELLAGQPLDHRGGLPMKSSLQSGTGRAATLVGRPGHEGSTTAAEGWVAPALLHELLRGERDAWQPHDDGETSSWHAPLPPFVHREARPGLAVQRPGEANGVDNGGEGTAAHGMLYFLENLRIDQAHGQPAGFYGRLQAKAVDARIPADALIQSLGMAGRKAVPVAFESPPALDNDWQALIEGEHLPDEVTQRQRFWLVSFTPVRPEDPWQPIREGILPDDISVVVEAVLSATPVTQGGLRMADRRARENRPFLPAGSSWLVHLEGGDAAARAAALKRVNATHPMGDAAEAAFGHGFVLVGMCKEDDQ